MRIAFVIALFTLLFAVNSVYAYTINGSDGTYCTDSDYNQSQYTTAGNCIDNSGTHTDYCDGGTVKDYVCVGNWNNNGTVWTVHCETSSYVCSSSSMACQNGACIAQDSCAGVTCNSPPPAVCDGNLLRTYLSPGMCSSGTCGYSYTSSSCQYGCSNGACLQQSNVSVSAYHTPTNPLPNAAVTIMATSSADSTYIYVYVDGMLMKTCSSVSSCSYVIPTPSQGAHSYYASFGVTGTQLNTQSYSFTVPASTTNTTNTSSSCPDGCNNPPSSVCDGSVAKAYYSPGICSSGTCSYSYTSYSCPNGCSNGHCIENNSSAYAGNCADTDSGINYDHRGTVTYNLNYDAAYRYTLTDSCSGNTLNEYYCDAQGVAHTGYYSCPHGCSEGACKAAECTSGQTQTATCSNGGTYTKSNCLDGRWVSVNYLADPCNNFNTTPVPMYRYAKWTCGSNYTTVQGSESSCKDEGTWKQYASANCSGMGREVTTFLADGRCDNAPPCASVACVSPPSGCYYSDPQWQNGCQTNCGRLVCGGTCNYNSICERGEENNCNDCVIKECPLTTKCSDGSTKVCYKSESGCRCEPCPVPANTLPFGCRQENENGFIRVICDNYKMSCPAIDRSSAARCSSNGGYPTLKHDSGGGCDYFYCDFGNQGAPPSLFGNAECPPADTVSAVLQKCDSLGLQSVVAFENGCKIGKCVQQRSECPVIGENEKSDAERKCSANNQRVTVAYGEDGCQYLKCQDQDYCQDDLPKEAYSKCADSGGQLIVNRDDRGCVSQSQCIGRGDTTKTYTGSVNAVPASSDLLSIAFKLEELKLQLDGLGKKSADIAGYYKTTGSTEEKRFQRVSDMFYAARDRVDEIKTKIRQRLDNLNTDDITEIKSDVRYIKDVAIKDILYIMLGTGDDIDSLKNGTARNCGSDTDCFNSALRICQPVKFVPEGSGITVELRGLEGSKCVLYASKGNIDMTCKLDKYSLGVKDPNTDILPYCSGPLIEVVKQMTSDSKTQTATSATRASAQTTATRANTPSGINAEQCVGCLDNGVCDRGECSSCRDCRGLQQGLTQGIQQGLQQGISQGLQQGLSQGIQQGLTQGIQNGTR